MISPWEFGSGCGVGCRLGVSGLVTRGSHAMHWTCITQPPLINTNHVVPAHSCFHSGCLHGLLQAPAAAAAATAAARAIAAMTIVPPPRSTSLLLLLLLLQLLLLLLLMPMLPPLPLPMLRLLPILLAEPERQATAIMRFHAAMLTGGSSSSSKAAMGVSSNHGWSC